MGASWIEGRRGAWRVKWRDGATRNEKTRKLKIFASETYERHDEAAEAKQAKDEQLAAHKRLRRKHSILPMKITDVLKAWQLAGAADGTVMPSTAAEYEEAIGRVLVGAKWDLVTDVTPTAIAAWATIKAGKGVNRPLAYLRSILRYAAEALGQPVHAAVIARKRRRGGNRNEDKPELIHSPDQLARLLARALEYGKDYRLIDHLKARHLPAARFHTLVLYLATCGTRPRTAVQLRVEDLNPFQWEMTLRAGIMKTRRTVVHPIPEHLRQPLLALVAGREPGAPLFLDQGGNAWPRDHRGKPESLINWWRREIAYDMPQGLRGIYDLKRWAITTMLENGMSVDTISIVTGISVKTLVRYVRRRTENARAQLDKFPNPLAATLGAHLGANRPGAPKGIT